MKHTFFYTFIFCSVFGLQNYTIAQCNSWDSYPNGVEAAKEQHVLYRDMFRSKQYKEAFVIWEKLFAHVQVPEGAKSRHFNDGITMYKNFAKEEKDKETKKAYIAKMVELYDKMFACLGESSKNYAWKGYNIYSARGSSMQSIEAFEKSVELGKMKTDKMVLVPLAQLTVYMFQSNMRMPEAKRNPKFTDEYMRQMFSQLEAIKDHNVENNSKDGKKYEEKWVKVEKEFDKIGGLIWGCDFHVGKAEPRFRAEPNNMTQNAELLALLKEKCGVDNELYQEINTLYAPWKDSVDYESAKLKFESLCNLEKGKFRQMESRRSEKKGDTEASIAFDNEAFEWYEKSLDDPITEDCNTTMEDKADLAYRIAYRYYKSGSYSKARALCYKAAEMKEGWGEPYMLIGTMYASSGKRCDPSGSGTGWDAQVVAWAAMDMWNKAKSIDPSVADKARSLVSKYYKYLPTKGDIFQRGHKEGQSYKIGCWMGVTTTIRAGGE